MLIPIVVERTGNSERSYDLVSRLMKDRIIMLNGAVNENSAHVITSQLLYLESESNADIHFYINSNGGECSHGLAIYDVMQFIKCDVSTVVMGSAASMGSFLAQAGTPGKRFVLPESRTMVHRVSSGTGGSSGSIYVQELQMEDNIRHLKESQRINERLTQLYVDHNSAGKTYNDFAELMKFDTFFDAKSAVEFGLADKVITKRG